MRGNFDNAEGSIKDVIPAGRYLCQVTSACEKEAQGTGRVYILLTMTVIEGSYKGSIVEDRLFSTNKSLNRLKLVVHRLTGVKMDGAFDINPEIFVGCISCVDVELEDREWEGEIYKNNTIPFSGYHIYEKNSPEEAEKFRKDLQSRQPKKVEDDDIPF